MDCNVATNSYREKLNGSVINLLDYCRESNWAGFDPYDALNSRLFARTPLQESRICRILFTQLLKRMPINVRPVLSLPREENPKALALFLGAAVKLSKLGLLNGEDLCGLMVNKLAALRSTDTPYWCWGYSFPWQTRTILVPKGAPNLVCTAFVANALLDAYEDSGDQRCLTMAISAAEYFVNELYWSDGAVAGLSYPLPLLRIPIHNANFLGAALLCRVYTHCGDKKFLETALSVARYSAARQRDDGSWAYGEYTTQGWVDNFHTGFNLCALQAVSQYAGTEEFQPHIRRGFEFYKKFFFREDGAPRYFHNRTYPIDIHSVAQSIITLLALKDLEEGSVRLAHSVYEWAVKNMRDKSGYFYYQVLPFYKNKISYIRWSQAWMLLALATLQEDRAQGSAAEPQPMHDSQANGQKP